MNTFALFVAFISLVGTYQKTEETKSFAVTRDGDDLGELISKRTIEGTQTTYLNITKIRAKLIGEIRVTYRIESVFKNKELESSTALITVNEETHSKSKTKRVGNRYEYYKNDKLKSTINGVIYFTNTMLVYNEPVGNSSSYAEEAGVFNPITKPTAGVYERPNSRGRKTVYHYQNAELKRMVVDVGLATLEMKSKP